MIALAIMLAIPVLGFMWCCCRGNCPCLPRSGWTVVISGVVATGPSPTACESAGGTQSCELLDATYILTSTAGGYDCRGVPVDGGCHWKYVDATHPSTCQGLPPSAPPGPASCPDGVCVFLQTQGDTITVN